MRWYSWWARWLSSKTYLKDKRNSEFLFANCFQTTNWGKHLRLKSKSPLNPPLRQEDKGKAPLLASGSQAHQQPRQRQRGNRRKQNTSGRHFTESDIPSSLILERLLEVNLTALKDPIRKPNTSAPSYHPDAFCVYHSYSPGHDTDDCWALKNKIQDLID